MTDKQQWSVWLHTQREDSSSLLTSSQKEQKQKTKNNFVGGIKPEQKEKTNIPLHTVYIHTSKKKSGRDCVRANPWRDALKDNSPTVKTFVFLQFGLYFFICPWEIHQPPYLYRRARDRERNISFIKRQTRMTTVVGECGSMAIRKKRNPLTILWEGNIYKHFIEQPSCWTWWDISGQFWLYTGANFWRRKKGQTCPANLLQFLFFSHGWHLPGH